MRIGVLGGTFNPVHIGHLLLAETAREELQLNQVIWVPSFLPPHKGMSGLAAAEARYRMVLLAVEGNPHYGVSRIELDRKGRSYSVETLQELKRSMGKDTELFFITGSDSLEELPAWKSPRKILALARFVVAERPGHEVQDVPSGAIVLRPWRVNVSSSEIRRRIRKGQSVRYMVPERVRHFIADTGLYRRERTKG